MIIFLILLGDSKHWTPDKLAEVAVLLTHDNQGGGGWGNYLISFSIFVHRISGVCWSSKGITECCESNKKVSRLGRKVLQEFSESGRRLAAIKHPFGRFSQELWSPVSQRVRADVSAVGRQPRPSGDHSPGHANLQQHARSSVSGQTRPNAY